jgi:pimeloyl-ACP methyl ester esterase
MKIAMPDGCLLHVNPRGAGEASVVMLHGIMMSGEVFKRQVDALSGSCRVITVDLRGFGQSDKPASGYSVDTYVSDLKAVIDRLELVRPVIAGWSMGGLIAMAFAAKYHDLASRLILIGSSPCLIQRPDWPDAVPPAAVEQLGQLLATDWGAGVEAFCGMMFPEDDAAEDADFIRKIMLATPPHATFACFENLGGVDFRPQLGAIRTPVSVICGEKDMACPPGASRFMAEKLGGTLTLIEGGGHCAFLTRPEPFNVALRGAL